MRISDPKEFDFRVFTFNLNAKFAHDLIGYFHDLDQCNQAVFISFRNVHFMNNAEPANESLLSDDKDGLAFSVEIVLLPGNLFDAVGQICVFDCAAEGNDLLLLFSLELFKFAVLQLHADAGHQAKVTEDKPDSGKREQRPDNNLFRVRADGIPDIREVSRHDPEATGLSARHVDSTNLTL